MDASTCVAKAGAGEAASTPNGWIWSSTTSFTYKANAASGTATKPIWPILTRPAEPSPATTNTRAAPYSTCPTEWHDNTTAAVNGRNHCTPTKQQHASEKG